MTEKQNVKIIAFVGLPGTGKSAATSYVTDRGIPKVGFGDIIMKEVVKAGLDPTQDNERTIREKLRLNPTGDQILEQVISEVQHLIDAGQHKIVVDGLGSWDSYKRLKHEFPGSLIIVAFTAQRHIRLKRLATRDENPLTEQAVNERDYDEIETLNKGGVLAMADYFLFDNGSLEQLHIQVDDLLRQLDF
jgi:dephospho-CoA kinase